MKQMKDKLRSLHIQDNNSSDEGSVEEMEDMWDEQYLVDEYY